VKVDEKSRKENKNQQSKGAEEKNLGLSENRFGAHNLVHP
jgi:hypothetical protein